ncbi:MAG: Rrf2 family transcriptional regulator [Acidobacteria bacterium]|nr:Rrf2 family transcriptional regulator [Acidobacteriota bacterium]
MKLTAKSDYAILALFHLAAASADIPVQSRDISVSHHIPHRFLEQILLSLKRAGLVRSVRGAKGGYQLARAPGEITLRDAVEAVEGGIQLFGVIDSAGHDGDRRLLQGIWKEIEENFLGRLGSVTLDDLRNRQQQQRDVLMYHI